MLPNFKPLVLGENGDSHERYGLLGTEEEKRVKGGQVDRGPRLWVLEENVNLVLSHAWVLDPHFCP